VSSKEDKIKLVQFEGDVDNPDPAGEGGSGASG
jgi:hypothetical protein